MRDAPPPDGAGAYLAALSVDRLRVSEGVVTVRRGRLLAPGPPAAAPPAAGPEVTG